MRPGWAPTEIATEFARRRKTNPVFRAARKGYSQVQVGTVARGRRS